MVLPVISNRSSDHRKMSMGENEGELHEIKEQWTTRDNLALVSAVMRYGETWERCANVLTTFIGREHKQGFFTAAAVFNQFGHIVNYDRYNTLPSKQKQIELNKYEQELKRAHREYLVAEIEQYNTKSAQLKRKFDLINANKFSEEETDVVYYDCKDAIMTNPDQFSDSDCYSESEDEPMTPIPNLPLPPSIPVQHRTPIVKVVNSNPKPITIAKDVSRPSNSSIESTKKEEDVSHNLSNLVRFAISGVTEEAGNNRVGIPASSPTLSMLLDTPPLPHGAPLTQIPLTPVQQPVHEATPKATTENMQVELNTTGTETQNPEANIPLGDRDTRLYESIRKEFGVIDQTVKSFFDAEMKIFEKHSNVQPSEATASQIHPDSSLSELKKKEEDESPNLSNLVQAISGSQEVENNRVTIPANSPTLSMLLELPPRPSGNPVLQIPLTPIQTQIYETPPPHSISNTGIFSKSASEDAKVELDAARTSVAISDLTKVSEIADIELKSEQYESIEKHPNVQTEVIPDYADTNTKVVQIQIEKIIIPEKEDKKQITEVISKPSKSQTGDGEPSAKEPEQEFKRVTRSRKTANISLDVSLPLPRRSQTQTKAEEPELHTPTSQNTNSSDSRIEIDPFSFDSKIEDESEKKPASLKRKLPFSENNDGDYNAGIDYEALRKIFEKRRQIKESKFLKKHEESFKKPTSVNPTPSSSSSKLGRKEKRTKMKLTSVMDKIMGLNSSKQLNQGELKNLAGETSTLIQNEVLSLDEIKRQVEADGFTSETEFKGKLFNVMINYKIASKNSSEKTAEVDAALPPITEILDNVGKRIRTGISTRLRKPNADTGNWQRRLNLIMEQIHKSAIMDVQRLTRDC